MYSHFQSSIAERDDMIQTLQHQARRSEANALALTQRIARLGDASLGLGSPEFLARNVSLDLSLLSLDSLRELKVLVDRESEKDPYEYYPTTDVYKCKWCEQKSNLAQNIRKHQSSTHFKILVQYRATYGRFFIQVLDDLISKREV
jgi:hypothetical protein